MAKAPPGKDNNRPPSKSQAVREAMAQNPKADSKQLISLLAGKGVKVKPSLIYLIRSQQKKKKRRQKREQATEVSRQTGAANPVELIIRVRNLALDAGGIRNLKKLVDLLAE
jgi:hypothetical protein